MSGEPDSLVGCDIRLLTTRTEQEKHRKIKINLWKVRGGGSYRCLLVVYLQEKEAGYKLIF